MCPWTWHGCIQTDQQTNWSGVLPTCKNLPQPILQIGLPRSGHFVMSHLVSVSRQSGGIIFLLSSFNKPPEHYQTQDGNCNIRCLIRFKFGIKPGILQPKPWVYSHGLSARHFIFNRRSSVHSDSNYFWSSAVSTHLLVFSRSCYQ